MMTACALSMCAAIFHSCSGMSGDTGSHDALVGLDRLLEAPDTFSDGRRNRISYLSQRLDVVSDPTDRYKIYRGLYGQYRHYRCDSAMLTAEARLRIARAIGGQALVSASLNLAESYSESGNYNDALEILDTIPRDGLADYLLKYLYDIYRRTYRRLADRDAVGSHKLVYAAEASVYRDSSLCMHADSEPDYYLILASKFMDAGSWNKALQTVQRLEEHCQYQPASTHLALKAEIYRHLNRRKDEVNCLARAAAMDISEGRKDSPYLTRLAITLEETGDVDRAYRYIRRALADVRFSQANAASFDVLEALPIIEHAHQEAQSRRMGYVYCLTGVILLMAVVLGLALRIAGRRLSANRRMRASLEKNNRQLAQANDALKQADLERIAHINGIFSAYSDSIERIATFRRTLSRLLTVRKYNEAADLLKEDTLEMHALQDMYSRFDSVFLNICPDFIETYNEMVRPEERLAPGIQTLTAPLRVLALMKLGVVSTRQLAEMLHYNTQTIYNYRNRLKNALAVDKERFDQWVATPPSVVMVVDSQENTTV